jgi:hypothetical protein
MRKKESYFLLRMLIMVLVFGMVVTGCDSEDPPQKLVVMLAAHDIAAGVRVIGTVRLPNGQAVDCPNIHFFFGGPNGWDAVEQSINGRAEYLFPPSSFLPQQNLSFSVYAQCSQRKYLTSDIVFREVRWNPNDWQ